jgi:hypothetical protein
MNEYIKALLLVVILPLVLLFSWHMNIYMNKKMGFVHREGIQVETFNEDGSWSSSFPGKITHWMPLPLGPHEIEDNNEC